MCGLVRKRMSGAEKVKILKNLEKLEKGKWMHLLIACSVEDICGISQTGMGCIKKNLMKCPV